MNIIDIIAIIPYFITLATVVAEEEDTLNLPRAPVSPQVSVCFKLFFPKNLCSGTIIGIKTTFSDRNIKFTHFKRFDIFFVIMTLS